MKKLNILKINFLKNSLIESSAGTGKTFSIIILFLRLALNINIKNKYIKNLNVNKILILTFTNYSKNEIYKKIKIMISEFKKDCIKKNSNNIIYKKIIKKIKNINKVIEKLSKIEKEFDGSSILTIHQFCNNIIRENNFLFKIGFYKKIIKDEEKIILNSIKNFWRKNFYKLPKEIVKIIYFYWKEPKKIFIEIKNIIKNNIKTKLYKKFEKNNIKSYHTLLIKKIIILKKKWKTIEKTIKKIIKNLKKNKKGYKIILRYKKKINIWYKKKIKNYNIPKEIEKIVNLKNIKTYVYIYKNLKYFSNYIKKFFKKKFFMKEFIIYKIINKIPKIIKIEKKKESKINFDDLTKCIKKSIEKNKNILLLIKKKYPIAIIDEFQDTDIYQQKIFLKIYNKKSKKNIMIVFSDPKQCIYNFRKSNILLYNNFKKKIKNHYFLDTNWRSSPNIVKFINKIFLKNKYPFLTKKIKFIKTKYKKKNNNIKIIINKSEEKNFQIIFYKKSKINFEKYFLWASDQCAKQISKWLSLGIKKKAIIKYHNKKKIIEKKDIVILVKNKSENNYLKKSLNKYGINSYYQLEKINIYKTEEIKEILILLKSTLDFSNKQKIINANSTKIISNSIHEIYKININKKKFFKQIKIFKKYNYILRKEGILNLIKYIIKNNIIKKNIFNKNKMEKYIKKYFYIAKHLEKKIYKIKKINLFIYWLEKKIFQENEKKKYFNKNEKTNKIKITTIYKSKGLEYPIVIIPFLMHFKKEKNFIYYDKKKFIKLIDLKKKKYKKKIFYENIKDSIRLLYVSLTRAIVHCTIIISAIKKRKNTEYTDVHNSGIGNILQNRKKKKFKSFKKIIKKLKKEKFLKIVNKIKNIKKYIEIKKEKKEKKNINLKKKYIKYKIISFTKINNNIKKNKNKNEIKNFFLKKDKKKLIFNTYTFPRGKIFGKILHKILKKFINKNDTKIYWIKNEIKKYNLNYKWAEIIYFWMKNIINTSISKNGIKLSKIKKNNFVQDMKFNIYIKKKSDIKIFNKLIYIKKNKKKKYKICKKIFVGIIDIVFLWKNKYYFIDFKSNYLGNKKKNYSKKKIKKYILKNKYDIQYKMYLLGINTYLKKNIKKYKFKKHFGGIFYLFLRSFEKITKCKKYGIFFIFPKKFLKKINSKKNET
ncbi:exodeoxyribonuclease V subunit beta [Buchnera aphidicola (Ceratovacuna keduensis)]|uniref:exodeoxyribonuclease V subunit beta n=1 Tax=Buchnera aphidicola TaxID=9 RepID=UPI0031B83F29